MLLFLSSSCKEVEQKAKNQIVISFLKDLQERTKAQKRIMMMTQKRILEYLDLGRITK